MIQLILLALDKVLFFSSKPSKFLYKFLKRIGFNTFLSLFFCYFVWIGLISSIGIYIAPKSYLYLSLNTFLLSIIYTLGKLQAHTINNYNRDTLLFNLRQLKVFKAQTDNLYYRADIELKQIELIKHEIDRFQRIECFNDEDIKELEKDLKNHSYNFERIHNLVKKNIELQHITINQVEKLRKRINKNCKKNELQKSN